MIPDVLITVLSSYQVHHYYSKTDRHIDLCFILILKRKGGLPRNFSKGNALRNLFAEYAPKDLLLYNVEAYMCTFL